MSIGLVAYALTKVFVPYFYAVKRPRVPLLASLLAVAANLLTLGLLFDSMGFQSAGLGMALGNLANGGLLLLMYRGPESLLRRIDLRFLFSLVGAALGMSLAVLILISQMSQDAPGFWAKALGALGPVFLGAATYLGLAVLFRVPEATGVIQMVTRRFARSR